jgi:hypothetical protein
MFFATFTRIAQFFRKRKGVEKNFFLPDLVAWSRIINIAAAKD